MHRLVSSWIALAAATAALAAAEPPGRFDADALAQAVAPFIDEQTIAVVHADLPRIDGGAVVDRIAKLVDPETTGQEEEIAEARATVVEVLRGLLKAGARDAFLVVSLADVPEEPLLIVVPLRRGADERAIRGILYSGRPDGPTSRPDNPAGQGHARTQVTTMHGAAIRCNWRVLRRVEGMKPHARPELAQAFAAAGDSPIRALLLPTDDNRRVLEEMMPELPKELGGGRVTAVTRGLRWAAAGVSGPPKPSLHVVIQSADAEAAATFDRALDRIYGALAAHEQVRRAMPDVDKLLAALRPKPTGDRLVLDLGSQAIDRLLDGPVADALNRRRQRELTSLARLALVGVALATYRARHDGAAPADLQELVKARMLGPKALLSPITGKAAYVYLCPPAKLDPAKASELLVAYEDPSTHGQGRTAVLYADGHANHVDSGRELQQLIERAKAARTVAP